MTSAPGFRALTARAFASASAIAMSAGEALAAISGASAARSSTRESVAMKAIPVAFSNFARVAPCEASTSGVISPIHPHKDETLLADSEQLGVPRRFDENCPRWPENDQQRWFSCGRIRAACWLRKALCDNGIPWG